MSSETLDKAKALLEKAAAIGSKLDSANVQLGNLYFARDFYKRLSARTKKRL